MSRGPAGRDGDAPMSEGPIPRADPGHRPTIRDVTTPLPDLVLYTRAGCHLCDETRSMLEALLADRAARGLAAPRLVERDIDADPALHDRYAFTIPVVALGDTELELATSPARLRRLLADTLDAEAPA
jgi:hypothetical protein